MLKFHTIIALFCCSSALTSHAMVPAAASEQLPTKQSIAETRQGAGVSLDQAVAMVQAKYGAKVMRANTVNEDGRTVHYIRLIAGDRARVFTVRVDAASGREF